jgi:hypothetical protein
MDCERSLDDCADESEDGDVASVPVRRHLETCPDCARLERSWRHARPLLRSLPHLPISDDFFPRLQVRIEAFEARRRRRRRAAYVSATAAAGLLLIGGFALLNGMRRMPDAAEPGPAARLLAISERYGSSLWGTAPAEGVTGREAPDREIWVLGESFAPAARSQLSRLAPLLIDPLRETRQEMAVYRQPVVYAAPSWTVTAAPVSLRFVAADLRSAFAYDR